MVPDITIKFAVDGNEKQLRYRALPLQVWSRVKAMHGYTPTTLIAAVIDNDIDAFITLIWLERRQRERNLEYRDVESSLTADTEVEMLDLDDGQEKAKDEEPDPT